MRLSTHTQIHSSFCFTLRFGYEAIKSLKNNPATPSRLTKQRRNPVRQRQRLLSRLDRALCSTPFGSFADRLVDRLSFTIPSLCRRMIFVPCNAGAEVATKSASSQRKCARSARNRLLYQKIRWTLSFVRSMRKRQTFKL